MKNFLFGFTAKKKENRNTNEIYALQRSELTEGSCDLCLSMDGLVVSVDDKIASIDSFHEGCRGMWVQIMKDEKDPPPITGVPDELRKHFNLS